MMNRWAGYTSRGMMVRNHIFHAMWFRPLHHPSPPILYRSTIMIAVVLAIAWATGWSILMGGPYG